MVLQLTLQDPQRVAELTAELKKNTPVNAGDLWAKCLVGPATPYGLFISYCQSEFEMTVWTQAVPMSATQIPSNFPTSSDCKNLRRLSKATIQQSYEFHPGSCCVSVIPGNVLVPRESTSSHCYKCSRQA